MAAESAFNLGELVRDKAPLLSATLKDFVAEGASVSAVTYLDALKLRLALQDELERFLARFDAIITPPTTGEAPATLEQTGNPTFCSIWSLCGVPAVTIPVGSGPRGLPLGLQLVGRKGKDGELLSAARWCEGRFPFPGWRKSHEPPRPPDEAEQGKGPLRVGLIGAGKFGSMYLAQAKSTAGIHLAAIADLAPARASEALRRTGWPESQGTAASLPDALERGTTFITDDAPP